MTIGNSCHKEMKIAIKDFHFDPRLCFLQSKLSVKPLDSLVEAEVQVTS
jgi:hypothetical protein